MNSKWWWWYFFASDLNLNAEIWWNSNWRSDNHARQRQASSKNVLWKKEAWTRGIFKRDTWKAVDAWSFKVLADPRFNQCQGWSGHLFPRRLRDQVVPGASRFTESVVCFLIIMYPWGFKCAFINACPTWVFNPLHRFWFWWPSKILIHYPSLALAICETVTCEVYGTLLFRIWRKSSRLNPIQYEEMRICLRLCRISWA